MQAYANKLQLLVDARIREEMKKPYPFMAEANRIINKLTQERRETTRKIEALNSELRTERAKTKQALDIVDKFRKNN